MKDEILVTLKGAKIWRKGTVFDDAVSPIPDNILREVRDGSTVVRVLAESPFAVTETKIEQDVEETPWLDDTNIAPTGFEEPKVELLDVPLPETTYLPKLEAIIQKSPSISAAAKRLGVSYQAVSRWRSGKSTPNDESIALIIKEFEKVKEDDQD